MASSKTAPYRAHLPDLNTERFQRAKTQDPYTYARFFSENHAPPWLFALTEHWKTLLEEEFRGVTSDGTIKPNLFPTDEDDELPLPALAEAYTSILSHASPTQRTALTHPITSKAWRSWSNPEILLRPLGVRLEEANTSLRDAILRLVELSLSPEGYRKARDAMRINGFLGEVVEIPRIMNEFSYNFLLFGSPPTAEEGQEQKKKPWGWLLYGHHLSLSAFFRGSHLIISPVFVGAEPNIIDAGPWAGTRILHREEALGAQLISSLSPDLQKKAQLWDDVNHPSLKDSHLPAEKDGEKRWNKDDQRHLCGAFRDNRVVPYEGVRVGELPAEAQELVLKIAGEFLVLLPEKARKLKLELIRKHLGETYLAWIGALPAPTGTAGEGEEDEVAREEGEPFYYRIQSPVTIFEFDHHSGVFLTNETPKRFHVHTIIRTPNGGDYGQALRREGERLE